MESGWAMGNIMERMRSMGTGAVGATGSFMAEGPTCLSVSYSTTLCWSLPPQSFVCRACICSICPAVKQPEYKKVPAWCSQKLSTQSWVWAVTLANVSFTWNAVLSWTEQSVNLDGIKSVVTAGKNGGECWKIHSHAKIFCFSRTKSLVKWALLRKSGLKV